MPDDLNRTDSVQSDIGFGYVGLGICESCDKPNHVFASSIRPSGTLMCVACWSSHFFFSDTVQVNIPTSEMYPILNDSSIASCAGCVAPLLPNETGRWATVIGLLADRTTEVMVHARCLHEECCDTCNLRYATTEHRSYRAMRRSNFEQVQSNLFAYFTRVEGTSYCGECATIYMEENGSSDDYIQCESCEGHWHVNDTGWWAGTRYCDHCIETYVYDCSECGITRWEDDDHECEYDNDEDDNDESLIHSYSYRPSPFFFGEGKYHFGFELEVESRGNGRYDGAQLVQNTLGGHAYLKEDASINDGFEIVTHPHTLEKYHTDFNWDVLEKLKKQGYRSWNTTTCGIHVHVSRTAFGGGDPWDYRAPNSIRSQWILQRQSHELRFMKLIYDNQRQVERISGRSSDRYASFEDKGQLVRKVKSGYQENGRFSAINTENDETIEVRVFKGSLRKERVLSAIEFVHASVEYTRDIKVTSKNHALSWLKFTGYVASNAELYPNLVTIMSESFANDANADESDN